MSNKAIEEYLETLYRLAGSGKIASTTEISENLKITPASVTEMLKKLDGKGYIKYIPYQGAELTPKGYKIGERITRKHRLLENFLYKILKIGKEKIHKQACEMEHSLSDEAEESLCRFLEHPDKCPDDENTIPPCDLEFSSCEECLEKRTKGIAVGDRSKAIHPINVLNEHATGKVAFIRGDHKVLQRLLDLGLTPGTSINIVRIAPFKGPIEISVRGSKLALGQDIAANVFVEMVENNS